MKSEREKLRDHKWYLKNKDRILKKYKKREQIKNCPICNKLIYRNSNFCHSCATKNQFKKKGHNQFKGGRLKDTKGYILIHSPTHPNKTSKNYVFEHRLVMEKKLGRYLRPEEIVHHINGIRDDNREENLELFENSKEHRKYHLKLRSKI